MELTPRDVQSLRIIIQRAVGDCCDVFAAAASRSQSKAEAANVTPVKAKLPVAHPPSVSARKALYSIRETTELLGLGRSSIYEMIKLGKLHPVKIGKRTLLQADAIEAIITNGLK
jgi:excisionase family DNA binding protein